jgi:hypothetical protein
MKEFKKKYIKTIRLNSFRPLCMTEIGLKAIKDYNLPPFIDGSCRREPDFQNEFPSITTLCRQAKFAPNLYPNDIVVYITVKGKWFQDFDHYRLIGILVVKDKKDNHSQAAAWYRTNNKNLIPSNCMVPFNPPYNFDKTMGNYSSIKEIKRFLGFSEKKQEIIGKQRIKLWNEEYLNKSKKWGDFVITKTIFKDLHNPPILTIEEMSRIFGKVPNTRNPNKISREELRELAKHADINFITE